MKNLLTIFFVGTIILLTTIASNADAQMPAPYGTEGSRSGMQGLNPSNFDWNEVVEHTIREDKEGKELWDKIQAKEINCTDLTDEQFGVLGEYFMGQMTGESHAAMNAMMIQMHGNGGEEQIHIVMGKRLSGCDTSAVFSSAWGVWMPMMQMMFAPWQSFTWGGGRWSSMMWGTNPMDWGFGLFGGIFMILWWVLIVFGIIALIKWLMNKHPREDARRHGKTALDILKERYAKGEITEKEFKDKKRDISNGSD